MGLVLVPLAILMGLVTYPWRAVPLLVPGIHRLPARLQDYLRLVGPAVLAALAAVNTMVIPDVVRHPSFPLSPEWLAAGRFSRCAALRGGRSVGRPAGGVATPPLRAAVA